MELLQGGTEGKRKEGKTDGRKERQKEGRKNERKDGRAEGKTEGQKGIVYLTVEWKEVQKNLSNHWQWSDSNVLRGKIDIWESYQLT